MKKSFLLLFVLAAFLLPSVALGDNIPLNLTYPTFPGPGGGFDLANNQDLAHIIGWAYYVIVGISGFAAFIMILWGGVEYLTSSGSPGRTGAAKERIKSALLGLLIVLTSFLILQLINPGLTTLTVPLP